MMPAATIPGDPVAYARSRHRGSQHYKPRSHREWERRAVAIMREAAPVAPLSDDLVVTVTLVYRRRSTDPRTDGRIRRDRARQDVDNVAKLALDAAVKAGWLVDDRHVGTLVVERWSGAPGEGPSVTVEIGRRGDDARANG